MLVKLDDASLETIVVIRVQDSVAHDVVKTRNGTHPLDPGADMQLVEILTDAV